MRYKKLDMNLLAALDILIRTRNVSQAADEMFMTQSAMSNALARLRTFFDDPLLVQVGRKMELSPLAESLAEPVRDIIVRVESTVLLNPTFDPASSTRTFTIVISDYSLAVLGPVLSRAIASAAPNVRLKFRPQHTTPQQLLERGEIDLLVGPDFVCSDNHPMEGLFIDPLKVVACAEGCFANRITLDDLRHAPQVVMEPITGQASFAEMALREVGIEPNAMLSTYSFSSIPDLIRHTDRIAVLQGRLAQQAQQRGGIVVHPLPVDLPFLNQHIQWHKLRSRDPGLMWLRDLVHTCAN